MESLGITKRVESRSLAGLSEDDFIDSLSITGLKSESGQRNNVVYVVLDSSGSMAGGTKLDQVREGVLDFSKSAIKKGYAVGIIFFSSNAKVYCRPTNDPEIIAKTMRTLFASGSTYMCKAIKLSAAELSEFSGKKVICLATDGMPNSREGALNAAKIAKSRGIEIMVIGTDDADRKFLEEIATCKELAEKTVSTNQEFQKAITRMSEKLSLPAPKKI